MLLTATVCDSTGGLTSHSKRAKTAPYRELGRNGVDSRRVNSGVRLLNLIMKGKH